MKYVQRDSEGRIVGIFTCRQPGFAEEEVPDEQAILYTPPKRTVPTLEFVNRLSEERRLAVLAACQENTALQLWLLECAAAVVVELDNQQTVGGLNYLVTLGLLTQDEVNILLA